jgi:hypothetical protein
VGPFVKRIDPDSSDLESRIFAQAALLLLAILGLIVISVFLGRI